MLLKVRYFLILLLLCCLYANVGLAEPIGDEPPCESCCDPSCTPDTTSTSGSCAGSSGCNGNQCSASLVKSSVCETHSVSNATGANSAGTEVSLNYASYNADGEKAILSTVMGFGWSHSYNIFLFQQGRDIFKQSPSGHTTQYKRMGRRGPLTATRSHQQTVVENPDGSIEIRNNNQLTFRFEKIPGNPLRVAGRAPWMLKRITDRNGNQTNLIYNNGLLEHVEDPYGLQVGFQYDGSNRLEKIIDPLGRVTELAYDSAGNLKSIKDPLLQEILYTYNVRHQIVRKTDRNGRAWEYLYDADGHPTGTRDADGELVLDMTNSSGWATNSSDLFRNKQRTYVPSTTTLTDGRGNQWKYDYDEDGLITKKSAPDGTTTTYTYDPATLNLATETDANGNTTSYEYDGKGNLIKQIDSLGNVTTYEYEPLFNQVTKITSYRGAAVVHAITEYEYDAEGNRIKETKDVGGLNLVREWTYDANGNVLTKKDPNSHIITNEYDTYGNLIKVTDAEGNATKYHYDKAGVPGYEMLGNRTKLIDANDHETRYEYDDLDRLIRETDPLGFAIEYQYDGVGNRIEVKRQVTQGPDSFQVAHFEYDVRDRLAKEIRDPSGLDLDTQYDYDGNDNRVTTTDPKGNATAFTYDVQNRLTQVTDALGNISETRYDDVGNRLCVIDANEHVTRYEYDALNRRIVEIRKMGETGGPACVLAVDTNDLVTQYFYDTGAAVSCRSGGGLPSCNGPTPGSANIAYTIDPESKYSYFKYDKVDRRWITIREVGAPADDCDGNDWCEYTEYDPVGNVVARTDANGNTIGFSYFDNDWLETQTVDPGGLDEVTTYTYDGLGNVKTAADPGGNLTASSYNDRNELTQADDSVGRVARYEYDGVGNRKLECDGNDNCTGYNHDAVNRLVDVVDTMGETTNYSYDMNSNLIKVTDRENHVTCHLYDAINRRTRTIQNISDTNCTVDGDDITTDTDYDNVGNVIQLADAKGNATQYVYDEAGRLTLETYADGTTRQFAYDKASNLAERTDQLGQVTQYEYNDLYYLMERDYLAPGEENDSFTYDTGGRMTSAIRGTWIVDFNVYDAANRLLQTTQDAGGLPNVITYNYDIPARTRTVGYPGGRSVTEQMDARQRIADIASGAFNAGYSYDLGNRVLTRSYNNGVTATYSYNANNWITGLDHANGGGTIAGFGHGYDKEGNKLYADKAHNPGKSEAYDYDDLYRLIDYTVGTVVGSTVPVPVTQRGYDLDKVGNWDQFTVDDDGAGPGVPVDYNNTPNQMNEYDDPSSDGTVADDDGIPDDFMDDITTPGADGENFAHTHTGNRAEDGKRVYEYDDENRLVQVTRKFDSVVSEYQYDALGRRVVKTVDVGGVGEEVIRFKYDDARVIEEEDAGGATLATYVYGNYIDEVLSMQRGGNDYYYHQNVLWSVVAVTDAGASVVERYAYSDYGCVSVSDGAGVPVPDNAWGAAHSAIGNPYMFTGRRWDEESGVYYYRARNYDCESGRFLQRDPLGYLDGMNLYLYVRDNPLRYTDPSGNGTASARNNAESKCRANLAKCAHRANKSYAICSGVCIGGGLIACIFTAGGAAIGAVICEAACTVAWNDALGNCQEDYRECMADAKKLGN
ncbi:RHS repeat-associated core domain-containing protein [Pseudomonadota bacterium]